MGNITLSLPTVGQQNFTEDPKIPSALSTIQTVINGNLDHTNLSGAAGILPAQLEGVTPGFSNIATSQSTGSTTFVTLATPDQVAVTLPANGLIQVWFQGQWQESVSGAARAAIFLGSNQLQSQQGAGGHGPGVIAAATNGSTAGLTLPLATCSGGLAGVFSAFTWSADVSTGQIVGVQGQPQIDTAGTILGGGATFGGPCYIFAAAGAYTVSVQFKASSGTVTALNRKLWATTIPFS
jgi:hypothetical protein